MRNIHLIIMKTAVNGWNRDIMLSQIANGYTKDDAMITTSTS